MIPDSLLDRSKINPRRASDLPFRKRRDAATIGGVPARLAWAPPASLAWAPSRIARRAHLFYIPPRLHSSISMKTCGHAAIAAQ